MTKSHRIFCLLYTALSLWTHSASAQSRATSDTSYELPDPPTKPNNSSFESPVDPAHVNADLNSSNQDSNKSNNNSLTTPDVAPSLEANSNSNNTLPGASNASNNTLQLTPAQDSHSETNADSNNKPTDASNPSNNISQSPAATAGVGADPNSSSKNSSFSSTRHSFMGNHAVADWLNTINIGNFLDFGNKYVLNHDQCFVFFNSCEDISFWIEPYGFYSHYHSPLKQDQKMNFTLASYGSDLGAKFSLTPSINLGAGVGYFHSHLHDKKGRQETQINGIYFGPAIEYLFTDGSAQCTIFGVKNHYHAPSWASDGSWDVNLRLEAEYDYTPPTDFWTTDILIHPFARIDYLNVFEYSHYRHSSFFYSKLGSRFDKVAYSTESVMLTANLDAGWVNMTPLSSGSTNLKPESKNQAALGFALVAMHTNGILVGFEYEAALGAHAPMHTGRVRVEWNW